MRMVKFSSSLRVSFHTAVGGGEGAAGSSEEGDGPGCPEYPVTGHRVGAQSGLQDRARPIHLLPPLRIQETQFGHAAGELSTQRELGCFGRRLLLLRLA